MAAFNYKGVEVPQKTKNIFDYSKKHEEIAFAVNHIHQKYPLSQIYLVGFSMGASMCIKYMSTEESRGKVQGMVSVSNPWDVYRSAVALNSFGNFIYSKFMSRQLYKKALFN